ncbi:MAG: hypothetical protein ACRCVT_01435 [Leadbetterella sp.]
MSKSGEVKEKRIYTYLMKKMVVGHDEVSVGVGLEVIICYGR